MCRQQLGHFRFSAFPDTWGAMCQKYLAALKTQWNFTHMEIGLVPFVALRLFPQRVNEIGQDTSYRALRRLLSFVRTIGPHNLVSVASRTI